MEIENTNVSEVEVQSTQSTEQVEEKMLPQSKVNEIVESRLKREREKLEKQFNERLNALEESQKLNAMSEQEKANYEAQKERETFEQERQAFYEERDAFNKAKYKVTIEQQLSEKGLPIVLSDMLVNLSAEEVNQKITVLADSLGATVSSQIQEKLKQTTTPQESTKQAKQLLTLEEIQNMTSEEYLKNKSLVEESLKAHRK